MNAATDQGPPSEPEPQKQSDSQDGAPAKNKKKKNQSQEPRPRIPYNPFLPGIINEDAVAALTGEISYDKLLSHALHELPLRKKKPLFAPVRNMDRDESFQGVSINDDQVSLIHATNELLPMLLRQIVVLRSMILTDLLHDATVLFNQIENFDKNGFFPSMFHDSMDSILLSAILVNLVAMEKLRQPPYSQGAQTYGMARNQAIGDCYELITNWYDEFDALPDLAQFAADMNHLKDAPPEEWAKYLAAEAQKLQTMTIQEMQGAQEDIYKRRKALLDQPAQFNPSDIAQYYNNHGNMRFAFGIHANNEPFSWQVFSDKFFMPGALPGITQFMGPPVSVDDMVCSALCIEPKNFDPADPDNAALPRKIRNQLRALSFNELLGLAYHHDQQSDTAIATDDMQEAVSHRLASLAIMDEMRERLNRPNCPLIDKEVGRYLTFNEKRTREGIVMFRPVLRIGDRALRDIATGARPLLDVWESIVNPKAEKPALELAMRAGAAGPPLAITGLTVALHQGDHNTGGRTAVDPASIKAHVDNTRGSQ